MQLLLMNRGVDSVTIYAALNQKTWTKVKFPWSEEHQTIHLLTPPLRRLEVPIRRLYDLNLLCLCTHYFSAVSSVLKPQKRQTCAYCYSN